MNFLHDYAIYTSGNEAPEEFHLWSGISCLSHLIGRRVWTDENVFVAYPNLYVILVGGPGSKKSTAMRLSKKIIAEFKNLPIAGSSITREAMIQFMAVKDSPSLKAFSYLDKPVKYSHMSIFANELVNLINSGGNPIGMVDFLTDVWDQPTFRDTTKNKGDHEIIGPFITILGCMTPSSIQSLNANKIISGGMIRRCIFIIPSRKGTPVPEPMLTQEQADAYNRCLRHAKLLQENRICGPFAWTRDVRNIYNDWYFAKAKRMETESSQATLFFLESAGELVMKVSMLLCLAEHDVRLVHTKESIELAIGLIASIEQNGQKIFEASGRNELSAVGVAVEAAIVSSPKPLVRSKVQALFWKDAKGDEFDLIIDHLVKSGKIVSWSLTDKTKGLVYNFLSSKEVFEASKGQNP